MSSHSYAVHLYTRDVNCSARASKIIQYWNETEHTKKNDDTELSTFKKKGKYKEKNTQQNIQSDWAREQTSKHQPKFKINKKSSMNRSDKRRQRENESVKIAYMREWQWRQFALNCEYILFFVVVVAIGFSFNCFIEHIKNVTADNATFDKIK